MGNRVGPAGLVVLYGRYIEDVLCKCLYFNIYVASSGVFWPK